MTNICDVIVEEYPINGLYKTAELLGLSVYRVRNIIKNNNLLLFKKRRVDISKFENINKKEIAYFLGFFWADGYISKNEITITIKSDDGYDILSVLNSFGNWRTNNRIRKLKNKEFEQVCIRVNDVLIKEYLLNNNYNNKSLSTPTEILSKIPNCLKPYFFRGLIDGDGCFCSKNRNYFSITGNINQDWFEIEILLKSLDIRYKLTMKQRKTGNSSYIVISSKKDIIKLGDYIYGDSFDGIGLKRKYIVYSEIKNKKISKYSRYK